MKFMWLVDREKIKESEYIDKAVISTGKRLENYNYTTIKLKIWRIMRRKPLRVYKINATLPRKKRLQNNYQRKIYLNGCEF